MGMAKSARMQKDCNNPPVADLTQNWAPRISQAWRVDSDIKPYWSNIATVIWLASDMYLATE